MSAGSLARGVRFVRASVTNQLARVAPRSYLRLTRQTGRGESAAETPEAIAAYFARCFDDYLRELGIPRSQAARRLTGLDVLEYGPGDLPGVALLLIAHGVHRVWTADRFPMASLAPKNIAAIGHLLAGLDASGRERAASAFRVPGDPRSGFASDRIVARLHPQGLSGLNAEVDLVLSRAVLEHVNNLDAIFLDMAGALRPGGMAVHEVDLKSHGLHRMHRLDFLAWPEWMWAAMFSHKGAPNRFRVDRYRLAIAATDLVPVRLVPTERARRDEVAAVRDRLAPPFRALSDEDLAWLGFWLVARKPGSAPRDAGTRGTR